MWFKILGPKGDAFEWLEFQSYFLATSGRDRLRGQEFARSCMKRYDDACVLHVSVIARYVWRVCLAMSHEC